MKRTIQFVLVFVLISTAAQSQTDKPLQIVEAENTLKTGSYAIIVGVNDYLSDDISDLKYCENDARTFAATLQAKGWNPENITLLTGSKASYESIYDSVFGLSNQKSIPANSTIIFFFSGHGVSVNQKNYLAPWDGSSKDSLISVKNIDVDKIEEALAKSAFDKKLMFLDACRNEFTRNKKELTSKGFSDMNAHIGLKILLSTKEGEYSIEDKDLKSGVFTYCVIDSLLDENTDTDKDGVICISELEYSIAKKMDSYSFKKGNQHMMTRGECDPLLPIAIIGKSGSGVAPTPLIPAIEVKRPLIKLAVSSIELNEINTFPAPDFWNFKCLDFTPDGSLFASGCTDNKVRLNSTNGGESLTFSLYGIVNSVKFSPDGKKLAACDNKGFIRLYSVDTGQEICTLQGNSDPDFINKMLTEEKGGDTSSVLSVCFCPDGKVLATGNSYGEVQVWSVSTGKEIRRLNPFASHVECVAFSPDGNILAACGWNKSIVLWETQNYTNIRVFNGHKDWVHAIAFSPDGKTLTSGSSDETIKFWSIESDSAWDIKTLKGHSGSVVAVTFSPDGSVLASCGLDKTVKFWNADSGKLLFTLNSFDEYFEGVSFTPDGYTIATITGIPDSFIKFWSITYK